MTDFHVDTPPSNSSPVADRRAERERAWNQKSLAMALSGVLSFAAMFAVRQFPAVDPVEVVGRSLIVGYEIYSERAELHAYAALLFTAVLSGVVLNCCLSRWPGPRVKWYSTCAAWMLPFLFAALLGYWWLPVFLLLLTVVAACGRVVFSWRLSRPDLALPAWLIGVTGWGVLYEFRTGLLGKPPTGLIMGVLPSIVLLSLLRWRVPRITERAWVWIAPLTVLVLMGVELFQTRHSTFISVSLTSLCCFLAAGLKQQRTWLLNLLFQSPWLFSIGCCVWLSTVAWPWQIGWKELLLITGESLVLGTILTIGAMELREFLVNMDAGALDGRWVARRWDVLPGLIFLVGLSRGVWFGVCLSLTTMAAIWLKRRKRVSTKVGYVLAMGTACALLPELLFEPGTLDVFHQGQIMSAIWEFEQGATLYSEVFPLRSTEFFVGWLARQVLPKTLIASEIPLQFYSPVVAAGACLLAWTWTRSVIWTLVISLLPLTELWGRTSGLRDGLSILCLGLASTILCSRWPWMRCLLVPLSLPMFFAGYDLMLTYLCGIACGMMSGAMDANVSWRAFTRELLFALMIVVACVISFSGVVAAWQGTEAAQAYWVIFADFSQHMSAFYGLPVNEDRYTFTTFIKSIAVLIAFAASGAVCLRTVAPEKRLCWGLLLGASSVFYLRALGRSDYIHVASIFPCVAMIAGLLMFESLLMAVRNRVGISRRGMKFYGIGAVVVLLLIIPARMSAPWTLWRQLQTLPTEETVVMPPDETLEQLVKPDEFLWSVDFGIGNYALRRHNPTRHALAYCIGSPGEQRRAVDDLKRKPPKVILWGWARVDGVDKLTRHYLLANHVLRNYQPGGILPPPYDVPYLIPMGTKRSEPEVIPQEFVRPQRLGHLPETWGRLRCPRIQQQVKARQFVSDWQPIFSEEQSSTRAGWTWDGEITPRKWNYVYIELAVSAVRRTSPVWPSVRLEFSPGQDFDAASRTEWDCRPDGSAHGYLVPIGCHPSWTWRSEIHRLRITSVDGDVLTAPMVTLYEMDE